MGFIIGHRTNYNVVGILRGQRLSTSPPPDISPLLKDFAVSSAVHSVSKSCQSYPGPFKKETEHASIEKILKFCYFNNGRSEVNT